jgi:uncharacterized membrane protein HdeD (DUF308 family)
MTRRIRSCSNGLSNPRIGIGCQPECIYQIGRPWSLSEVMIMSTDIVPPMISLFTKNWWVLLLRGIVAVLFGILAITSPGITLAVLVLLFGVYAVVDGCFALFAAIGGWSHREDRWLLLLEGFIGIGAGILTLRAPGITTVALLFFMAAWALATGVLRIVAAIRLRKEITGEFWLVLSGIASVVFAFLVMTNPAAGALAMAWLIGWYAVFLGATLVMLSIKLHNMPRLGDMPGGTYKRAA